MHVRRIALFSLLNIRLSRLFGGLLVVAALILFGSTDSADGHAVLERSVPAENQNLLSAPSVLELWFTEPLDLDVTSVRLLTPRGEEVELGQLQSDGDLKYAKVAITGDVGPGVYTVVYDNLSRADGHRYQGYFPFVVLNPDGTAPAASGIPVELVEEGRSGFLPSAFDAVLRWMGILGAAVLVGAAASWLVVYRPASALLSSGEAEEVAATANAAFVQLVLVGAPLVVVSASAQLFLLAGRLGGAGEFSQIIFGTRPGLLWVARIGLAVCAGLIVFAIAKRNARVTARTASATLFVAAGVVAAYSVGSHAAGNEGAVWAVLADFLHFSLTGLWLGSLAHVLLTWRRLPASIEELPRLIFTANLFDRFSALAGISVVMLIATGFFSAFVQLPQLEALWQTSYGVVLLVKLGLIVPLLAVALSNALYFKPALVNAIDEVEGQSSSVGDDAPAQILTLSSRMAQMIKIELSLAVLVLASVGVLSQTGTAQGEIALERAEQRAALALSEREHETFTYNANKLADDLAVAFRVDPNLVGINTYEIRISSAEAQELGPIDAVSLRFFYNDPGFGSTGAVPATWVKELGGDQIYQVDGAYFSIGGSYRVQIDVRRPERPDARAIFPLQVEEQPDPPRGSFALPFHIGTRDTTLVTLLVVSSLLLLVLSRQLALLAPLGRFTEYSSGLLMVVGAVLLAFSFVAPDGERGNPVALTEDSVRRGAILFARNCAQCHGDTGRGDGSAGQNLNPPPADFLVHVPYHNDSTLFGWIGTGVQGTGMPAFGDELSEDQRWDLVNFLRKNFGDENAPGIAPEPSPAPTAPAP